MSASPRRYGRPRRRSYAGGVDVAVNYTGGDTWVKSLRGVKRGGRMLSAARPRASRRRKTSATSGRTSCRSAAPTISVPGRAHGNSLELVRSRRLKAIIDRRFPLTQLGEALRLLEERKVFGKLVITPQA